MYVTPAQFIKDFPEFDTGESPDVNAVAFPPSQIQFYLNFAVNMLNPNRWDDTATAHPTQLEMGVELFIAHHIAMEAVSMRESNVDGIPGLAKGVKAAVAAGDTSITYDTGSVLELDAGHWNYTVYGKRFIRMARMAGMGPIQVGPGCGGAGGGAWAGPWVFNVPNQQE